ncbi:glycosyltransferase [Aquicoccus sp. SCR17]|nr:glycosyltransferase [Carideicomes alvinocaridis]
MRIDLCICTFRRPQVVETLASVGQLRVPDGVSLRVIVVDNDDTNSARDRVTAAALSLAIPLTYLHAPGRNIAVARNACLDATAAEWVAFLDDDELAEPGWLSALVARQAETGADAVFGPSRALYAPGAPGWIAAGDFHSQSAVARRGRVETGHTCNALLRWRGAPWRAERFAPALGRSGGEDTEFFFRLGRMGARYAIAPDAVVREPVPPARLSLGWLLRRRFRVGQSYALGATTPAARAGLFATAAAKAVYCGLRAAAHPLRAERRAFWLIRATMHAGVCAGCLRMRQAVLYGG